MSIENPDTWLLALRAALLLTAFVAFAWALRVSRRDTALGLTRLSAQHDQALAEIQQLAAKLTELSAQVHELSLPSPMISRQAPAPELAQPPQSSVTPSGARGYEMAIRMARGGASIDEIVASCGTTRAEARLLRRLHCAAGAHAA
ncbi:MAG TPA: DUF2802 domain-containing protein [Steroidobacteraceae bacterium]|nr:DUF2802 domain-containing protein [Steroidobacteraceae bacterium]